MIDRSIEAPSSKAEALRIPPGGLARVRGALSLSALACCLALLTGVPAVAQVAMNPAERLIEQERVRASVEAAFSHYYQPVEDGGVKNDNMIAAAEMLVEIGPPAVEFLAVELRQALRYNYTFVAYALGRMSGPEAEAALREAVEAAGQEINDYATMRRAWACYALAMQGHLDALDLFNTPDQIAADHWIHFDTTALEAASLLLASKSVPVLHAQLERYSKNEELQNQRVSVVKALRRIAHKDSLAKIIGVLDDDDPVLRREAADALHVYETPEAIDALMQRLKQEPLPHVRFAVAWSLRRIAPTGHTAEFLELLEEEYDVHVRGELYLLAAEEGDEATFNALKAYLGRPDPRDRKGLITAMRRFDEPGAANVLRAALNDDDAHVMEQGALGLTRIGGEKALQAFLGHIDSPRWLRARWSLQHLVALREPRTAPRVIARLAREMENTVSDPLQRERVMELGDTLITLRYRGDLEPLREGIARQGDGTLVLYLESMTRRLQALKDKGEDVARWAEALSNTDPEIRRLAIEVLGELGGEAGATALVGAFGRVERDEGVEILRALGGVDTDSARALIERVLTQPAFDPFMRTVLRDTAAYSARRQGGKRMAEALKAAVERRSGRDAKVLLYFMVLEGQAALPVFEKYRVERMRFPKWTRGTEQESFRRLAADLRAGRSIEFYDVPPGRFDFRRPLM